jgi:cytochrome P450
MLARVLGETVTLEQLETDPHPVLARLRASEPVAWVPVLGGWLVTRYDLALQVMRDARSFTVDDPRFSTAQVVGPSMLSLDGEEHDRHRAPFGAPFRPRAVRERFEAVVVERADALIDGFRARRAAELRREFAGPLAASIMADALGLGQDEIPAMLSWYDRIVAAVTEITEGGRVPDSGRRRSRRCGRDCSRSLWSRRRRFPVIMSSPTPPSCCSAGSRRPRG